MPVPATTFLTPSPSLLAELALLGSITGRSIQDFPHEALGPILRQFWSAQRALQFRWLADLKNITPSVDVECETLERIGLELFLVEMATRVWVTTWSARDRQYGRGDVERLALNMLLGLERVRREVLMAMVTYWDGPAAETISRLDRFRRRSERWTDLLIAGPAMQHDMWQFAQDAVRSRDFGVENWGKPAGGVNPASLLVSAGLRVMFGTPWPRGCCTSAPFGDLVAAIISSLPPQAFDAAGSLQPVWSWKAG